MIPRGDDECTVPGCTDFPRFGLPKTVAQYCQNHASKGMKMQSNLRCDAWGCNSTATYGYPDDKIRRCCSAHKSEGMQNISTVMKGEKPSTPTGYKLEPAVAIHEAEVDKDKDKDGGGGAAAAGAAGASGASANAPKDGAPGAKRPGKGRPPLEKEEAAEKPPPPSDPHMFPFCAQPGCGNPRLGREEPFCEEHSEEALVLERLAERKKRRRSGNTEPLAPIPQPRPVITAPPSPPPPPIAAPPAPIPAPVPAPAPATIPPAVTPSAPVAPASSTENGAPAEVAKAETEVARTTQVPLKKQKREREEPDPHNGAAKPAAPAAAAGKAEKEEDNESMNVIHA